MKKLLTVLLTLTLIMLTVGCKNKTSLKEGNDTLVSFKDSSLNIKTSDLYENLKEKYGINTLIDMLDKKILDKEYKDSDEIKSYVDTQVNSLKNYYNSNEEFLQYINNYGYKDEDELREYFKLNYKRNLAVEDYLEGKITDKEIDDYYNDKIMGDITGSHILIEVSTTDSMTDEEKRTAKEEAKTKADEALKKIKDGTSFEDVAKEYSQDEATNKNGGKMGTFNPNTLDDVTRQAYEKVKVGSYSDVIETEYGYEIFLKEKEAEKPKKDEVKSYIIETLRDEKLAQDSKLQYEGLKAIREKYGFEIKDDDLELYYENTMNNLMKNESE